MASRFHFFFFSRFDQKSFVHKMRIVISKSTKPEKKYMAEVGPKTIHFGQKGYSNYTQHNNNGRKSNYLARHRTNEDWTASGIKTAGFYSKHLLWNQKSFRASLNELNKKFKDFRFLYK